MDNVKTSLSWKIAELIDCDDGLLNRIKKECGRLIDSGGIDTKNSEGYLEAKAVLYVALENVLSNYRPLSKEGKEITKNLSHF